MFLSSLSAFSAHLFPPLFSCACLSTAYSVSLSFPLVSSCSCSCSFVFLSALPLCTKLDRGRRKNLSCAFPTGTCLFMAPLVLLNSQTQPKQVGSSGAPGGGLGWAWLGWIHQQGQEGHVADQPAKEAPRPRLLLSNWDSGVAWPLFPAGVGEPHPVLCRIS